MNQTLTAFNKLLNAVDNSMTKTKNLHSEVITDREADSKLIERGVRMALAEKFDGQVILEDYDIKTSGVDIDGFLAATVDGVPSVILVQTKRNMDSKSQKGVQANRRKHRSVEVPSERRDL